MEMSEKSNDALSTGLNLEADQSFTCLTSVSFLHSSWSKSRVWQNCTCLIQPKMGIVSCPTHSITKLLNQQEAGCIHLGSRRSFLMRRRSVLHHIYPPNSDSNCVAFGERLRDQLLSQFHYFVYQKENIASSLFHSKKLDDQFLAESKEDFHCRD